MKKPNREKNLIKSIKILKKPTGSVRFYKPKTEKTELNRTQTEKNKPNWLAGSRVDQPDRVSKL
jgi:hypothetical protein